MWMADNHIEPEEKYDFGWFYIWVASLNFIVNAFKMFLNVACVSLP
jgi:hypothetical protein